MKKIWGKFIKSENKLLDKKHTKLIKELSKHLKIRISKPEYFLKALTHRSYLEITPPGFKPNERLEFLGDSILGFVVAEYLFINFKDETEGYLTKARSRLVNRDALIDAAESLELFNFILYDKRFIKGSQDGLKTVVADALEALIGAIYLNSGLAETKKFVMKWIVEPNLKSGRYELDKNFKGQLLELSHSKKMDPPTYTVIKEEGPEHNKLFTIDVYIGDKKYGRGSGKNKKTAEQEAARRAFMELKKSK